MEPRMLILDEPTAGEGGGGAGAGWADGLMVPSVMAGLPYARYPSNDAPAPGLWGAPVRLPRPHDLFEKRGTAGSQLIIRMLAFPLERRGVQGRDHHFIAYVFSLR